MIPLVKDDPWGKRQPGAGAQTALAALKRILALLGPSEILTKTERKKKPNPELHGEKTGSNILKIVPSRDRASISGDVRGANRVRWKFSPSGWALVRKVGKPSDVLWPETRFSTPAETVVARSRTSRTVRRRAQEGDPESPVLYCKTYTYPTPRDRWKGVGRTTVFAPSRAQREWNSLRILRDLGFSAPEPLALSEVRAHGVLLECQLITRAIEPATTLDALLCDLARKERAILVEAFGRFVGQLHRSGFVTGAFRLRNVLARQDSGAWGFSLLDLPKARLVHRIRRRLALRDLTDLWTSARRILPPRDGLVFLKAYLGEAARGGESLGSKSETARWVARNSLRAPKRDDSRL